MGGVGELSDTGGGTGGEGMIDRLSLLLIRI